MRKQKFINYAVKPVCSLLFIISCNGVLAQEPIKRIGVYEPGRLLRNFANIRNFNGGKTGVMGNKELTPQRMQQMVNFNTSRVQHNLDVQVKSRLTNMQQEGGYFQKRSIKPVLNKRNEEIKIIPFNGRPAKMKPMIEQYHPALTEGDISAENIKKIGVLSPAEWNGNKLIDKSRTPLADIGWKAFDAINDCSGDVNLGVSETHVVVTSRTNVGFYDRQGNKQKEVMWVGEFFDWVKASTGVDAFFDTRSIYDPYRKRFWIGTLGYSTKETKDLKGQHLFCCAVSKTQNPMDGWYTYYWYSGFGETHAHDYPTLGVSQDVFIETNTGVDDAGNYYNNVCIFDAQSLADGQFKPGWRFWGWKNPVNNIDAEIHITPLIHHGSSPYTYLLGKQGNDVIVFGIKDPLQPNMSVSSWVLDFSSSAFSTTTAAAQKGDNKKLWFQNMSNFIFSATYRNNNLYFVMTDAKDWLGSGDMTTSLRLVRIRNTDNNYWYDINRVFGSNNKFDDKPTDKVFYGFPAVAVDAKGDMVTGYCRSGENIYPEIRASVWPNNGNDILPSRLLKAGEAPYKVSFVDWQPLPWADCSGAVADPADDNSVWIATSYATSAADNNWGVWVARVKMW